jgi:hypothetical protein
VLKAAANRAELDLDESKRDLQRRLRQLEPRQLLSAAALYALHAVSGPITDYTSDSKPSQAAIELLQSLVLAIPAEEQGREATLQDSLGKCVELAESCIDALGTRAYADLAETEGSRSHAVVGRESARLHTRILRNWAFPQHMREIVRDLFAPIECHVAADLGFTIGDLLSFCDNVMDASCDRIATLRGAIAIGFQRTTLRGTIEAWCELVGAGKNEATTFLERLRGLRLPVRLLRFIALAFFHQFFPNCYTFDREELQSLFPGAIDQSTLDALLKTLSHRFGDLKSIPFEHLATQSPIRVKPLIALDDRTYFVPIVGLFNSFFLEISEALLKPYERLWNRYLDRRATYLEETLSRRFGGAFPQAVVERNISWDDPQSGQRFETDLVVALGPIALVVEAKSGRVSDSARRGSESRLKRDFERLVDEPAAQSSRFAGILEDAAEDLDVKLRSGKTVRLPASNIRRAVCVSLTLDWLPAHTLCWSALVKAGLVDPQRRPLVSLSLADLIVVFDALESPAMRLHYFWRRSEWEQRVHYSGDEEDLLVYYLSSSLSTPVSEGDRKPQMNFTAQSNELRRYYMAKWADSPFEVPRPRRLLTDWWGALVERVQSLERTEKWEIAACLLDAGYLDQQEMEKQILEAVAFVRRHGNQGGRDAVVMTTPRTESHCALVGYAYRDLNREDRNAAANRLMGQAHEKCAVRRVVLIGRDVERMSEPYDFLSFSDLDRRPTIASSQVRVTARHARPM